MSAQEVELLPRWLVNLYRFLVGLCVIIFSTGVVGAYIMADLQREKRISHTWFAEMIYSMTRFNRMAVPALVNGSVVSAFLHPCATLACTFSPNVDCTLFQSRISEDIATAAPVMFAADFPELSC